MKLHLPITLLTAVLATFIALPAHAVEAPEGYELIYLPRNASLESYASLSDDEHLAFILRNSAELTPTNNTHWGVYDSSSTPSYTPLINGGNLFFGSNNSNSPVSLSFKDGVRYAAAFYDQQSLTFDTLSNLTFSNIASDAIKLRDKGSLTITHTNDYQSGTVDVLFENISTAISAYYGNVDISHNGDVTFRENGNSIYAPSDKNVVISENGNVTFSGNSGYAIYSSALIISHNGDVTFSENHGGYYASAIDSFELTISYNGNICFSGNSADSSEHGGAINAQSRLTISHNGDVTFSGNSFTQNDGDNCTGAAILAGYLTISHNGNVIFSNNTASSGVDLAYGGAISSHNTLSISNNHGAVSFNGNSASGVCFISSDPTSYFYYRNSILGGAIYANNTLSISDNNGAVSFNGNSASGICYDDDNFNNEDGYAAFVGGGAIYAYDTLSISNNNGAVSFSENTSSADTAIAYGGAIYAKGDVAINDNGDVLFCKNASVSTFTADEETDFFYNNNYAYANSDVASYGGAICLEKAEYSYSESATISGNGNVTFSGNYTSAAHTASDEYHLHTNAGVYDYYYCKAMAYGGAIYTEKNLTIENNADVTFSGNYAASTSTFLDYDNSKYDEDNGWVDLDSSYMDYYNLDPDSRGGAIYMAYSNLSISNNTTVSFQGNYTHSSAIHSSLDEYNSGDDEVYNYSHYSYGGAIYNDGGELAINNNDVVSFHGNYATADGGGFAFGGAIYSDGSIDINNNGVVLFHGNYATADGGGSAYGGAIHSDGSIDINNNGVVTFIGNYTEVEPYVYCGAGAIYNTEGGLNIQGNDSVLFEKNYENGDGEYRLRSIYSTSNMTLSAKTGGDITFYDSVYSSGSTYFNSDYTDAEGNTQSAKGDIIFSGKYTEQHLNEILAANNENRTATAEEILNSQTSDFSFINLQNGTLQVVDGARLNVEELQVSGDAKLLLRDAALAPYSSYYTNNPLSFATGSELELQGINSVTAESLTLSTGTTLTASLTDAHLQQAALSLSATLYTGGTLTLNLNVESEHAKGMYQIISLSDSSQYDVSGWTADNITFNGSGAAEGASFGDLLWQDGVLYYVASPLWSNASGNGVWSYEDENWNSGSAFRKGQDVLFADIGAGTVQLSGDIAPASINVNNSVDYLFTAAEGGGRLVGSTGITKLGAGKLTLATANAHTGDTELLEGTINIQHSTALGATAEGKAALISAAGTTLSVENGSQLVLAAEGNDIAGAVEIAEGAALVMMGGNYAASDSKVNGSLRFDGIDAAAGTLSGSGCVQVKDSSVSFSDTGTYKGSLSVEGNNAELTLTKGGYKGSGTVAVLSGRLTLENRGSITIYEGGQLAVSDNATVTASTINIQEGATLSIGDVCAAVELNSLLSSEMAVYTTAAAEGYDPSVAVHTAVGGVLETNSLNMFAGSTLIANGAHIDMTGAELTIENYEEQKINLVLTLGANYTPDSQVVLFSNVGAVYLFMDDLFAVSGDGIVYTVNAGDYFTGEWINDSTMLTYDSTANVVYLQGVNNVVPEPTTATLSLLALAALAMRRRRQK